MGPFLGVDNNENALSLTPAICSLLYINTGWWTRLKPSNGKAHAAVLRAQQHVDGWITTLPTNSATY